jgi:hypothetical protein
VLAGTGVASAEAADKPASARVTTLYHKDRSFRIPFNVNEQGRDQLKEIQLWVSEDSGVHWKPASVTTPDKGKFTFRARHDGEYWFAVRTMTHDGRYSPPKEQTVEPSMKVIVDSTPPSLVLEADGRRGSLAQVRWDAKDENLDLKSLFLEYQVEGARDWRRVPLRKPAVVGVQSWDAGTADNLRVRASVADKAGNVAERVIALREGSATLPDFSALDPEDSSAPPVQEISRRSESPIDAGSAFPPVEDDLAPPARPRSSASPRTPRGAVARRGREDAGAEPDAGPFPPPADWERRTRRGDDRAAAASAASPFPDPFPSPDGAEPALADTAASAFVDAPRGGGGGAGAGESILVSSPRFKLQYAIDDAGPGGPAVVELWQTHDGGRTWIRRGEDPDKTSPFDVDLGDEGTFGLTLVARSASGLGDRPPAPGDAPQTWVEVDSTPPGVELFPTKVGMGVHAGKVAISWRARDTHLPPRAVSLFWRADQAGSTWQPIAQTQENIGQFVWTVPPDFPPKFHVRVEAIDTVGNKGGAETTDAGPVLVDRSRPRSRIIGLDPNARSGDGPSARPLR